MTPPETPLRILVVEDDDVQADHVATLLETSGWVYELDRVLTINEALSCLARTRYSLVLLDLRLPNGRGIDTINRVMSAPLVPPTVVTTAAMTEEERMAALRHGVQDCADKTRLAIEGWPYLRELILGALARSEGFRGHYLALLGLLGGKEGGVR